jgi:resuscitation-promoting factor RpfB
MLPIIPIPIEMVVDRQPSVYERTASPMVSRSLVRVKVKGMGWSDDEWVCLDELIQRESEWNMNASNPRSSAYGLFQVLKTPEDSTLKQQVRKGIKYLDSRHSGSACQALKHHDSKGWY